MRIAFFSHTAAGGVFRVGSHHLSRDMARMGHEVVHVSSPISLAHHVKAAWDSRTRLRIKASAMRRDQDGVVHIVPFAPLPFGSIPTPVARLQAQLMAVTSRNLRNYLRETDIAFVDQPLLSELALKSSPRKLVYRPTDAHFVPAVRRAEKRLLAHADAVSATSGETLRQVLLGTNFSAPSLVLENGVEFDRFSQGWAEERESRAVYLGAVDHRFDWQALIEMASAHPNLTFELAGPVTSPPTRGLPANVKLLGPVAYSDAAQLLRGAKVGLLPFNDDPGNAGRSPMKYFEYLAAGLSVVGRSTPSVSGRGTPNVWLYEHPSEASETLASSLRADQGQRRAGQAAAAAVSWHSRANRLLEFANGVGARG